MGTVVVGYVPKPEGEAALAAGINEAKLRGSTLIVVNSHRGGQDFDGAAASDAERDMAGIKATLEAAGVEHDIRQLVRGFEPAEDLISIAEANNAELLVIEGMGHNLPRELWPEITGAIAEVAARAAR